MIVVVDNYDSFTYNLAHYLAQLGARVEVVLNDAVDVDELAAMGPEGVLFSPGPGAPDDAGITLACVERFAGSVPLFGVCLGHQAIARAYGGQIVRAERLMHGRTSPIEHRGRGVFHDLPSPLTAARYHSLIVDRRSIPDVLEVTAWTAQGEVMGLRHRELEVEGVQFHPESFLTEHGHALLENFLERLPRRGAA